MKMESRAVQEEINDEEEVKCGVLGFHPEWLQKLANKNAYVTLFGLIGMNQLAMSSYSVASITTIEKRFKIDSKTSGMISGGWDLGTIVSSMTMAYAVSGGHKTRWVALGTLMTSIACFSQLLPYLIYGPGSDALAIADTSSENYTSSSMCGHISPHTEHCGTGDTTATPSIMIFMSQFILGSGTSMYWTLGIAYLDDNVRKSEAPWLLAISSTIRLFGAPIGFYISSKAVELFVDPTLTPSITNKDPRWIGAWWIGYIPFGVVALFFAQLLTLFPRSLPRAPSRLKKNPKKIQSELEGDVKKEGFRGMLKRLLNNRLLLFNTLSYVFFMFGVTGQLVFMPKYMETQFHLTAADANYITGFMGLVSSAFGVIISGLVISKVKPSARKIAAWNVIVELLGIVCVLIYAYLGCSNLNFHGEKTSNGSYNLIEECNSGCMCDQSVPYEPICDITRNITFFSPCHAGCKDILSFENGSKIFQNCSCIPNPSIASDSYCPVECGLSLKVFLILYTIINFLSATSHSGLVIIQFRSVAPEDKSVAMAISEVMCSVLAYIPGPIVYGYLQDLACVVWGQVCGEQGNCWLYDGVSQRFLVNFSAAGLLLLAAISDCGIWYYSENLNLYDEEEDESEMKDNEKYKKASLEHNDKNTDQNEMALQSLLT